MIAKHVYKILTARLNRAAYLFVFVQVIFSDISVGNR